jgi:hypothetical protein
MGTDTMTSAYAGPEFGLSLVAAARSALTSATRSLTCSLASAASSWTESTKERAPLMRLLATGRAALATAGKIMGAAKATPPTIKILLSDPLKRPSNRAIINLPINPTQIAYNNFMFECCLTRRFLNQSVFAKSKITVVNMSIRKFRLGRHGGQNDLMGNGVDN